MITLLNFKALYVLENSGVFSLGNSGHVDVNPTQDIYMKHSQHSMLTVNAKTNIIIIITPDIVFVFYCNL